jgi:hypothetical protein
MIIFHIGTLFAIKSSSVFPQVFLKFSSSTIQYAPLRAGDVKYSRASVDKINKTGYQAVTIFKEGLQRAIRICGQINHKNIVKIL